MIMGFLVVTAVLVVTSGRLGDMFGRVRMYNLGFVVFTVCSVLLSVTWMTGTAAAWWLIGWRVVQGIGGAFLMANSTAIVTDAFPASQRGTAIGINSIAAIAGSLIGLLLGGVLAPHNWHLVFAVSVPVGVGGTAWAYLMLKETSVRRAVTIDWWGNVTFAVGLIAVLVALTGGMQPYRGHALGWTSPWVLAGLVGGAVVLAGFVVIELTVPEPLLRLSLFRHRGFAFGNIANLLTSLGRGGLPFILILWLQGVWLPQHGYGLRQTPLWAGLCMLPMTAGFLLSAPLAGIASDRFGTRKFTVGGPLLTAVAIGLLLVVPADVSYWQLATVLLLYGIGSGTFISPNRAEMMSNVPPDQRGAGAGITAAVMNAASAASLGIFFSLIVAGLTRSLPSALYGSLSGHGPAAKLTLVTGHRFFPQLITQPFHDGLAVTFWFAIAVSLAAAAASALAGKPRGAPAAGPGVSAAVLEPPEAELAWGAVEELPAPSLAGPAAGETGPVITGTVTRPDGAPAAGVTVTALDAASVIAGTAVTGGDGRYRLPVPAPGHYVLVATGQRTREIPLDPHVTGGGPVLLTIGGPA
jgi:MFS family permease